LLLALRLLFALWLPLIVFTPAVFAFPLLFVSTPVFDETLRLLALREMFAFVSTTPWRGGLPALVLAFVLALLVVLLRLLAPLELFALLKVFALFVLFVLFALSVVEHPVNTAATTRTNATPKFRRMPILPCSFQPTFVFPKVIKLDRGRRQSSIDQSIVDRRGIPDK
jgi:hypothetical protein